MSKTSNSSKRGKLKVGVDEFVEPILKRLLEAKNHEYSSSTRGDIEDICTLVRKMEGVLKSREKLDSEIIGHFGRIERDIDSINENKREGNEDNNDNEKINCIKWKLVKKQFVKLILENQNVDMSMVSSESIKKPSDLPQESATYEIGEPSNNCDPDYDRSFNLDKYINQLNPENRDCLYSLCIFPKNAKLKKRQLLYWWIGLGFVPLEENKNTTTEQVAEMFFSDLVNKGILQPMHTRRHNEVVDSSIINPIIHRQLVSICESKGLLTDMKSDEGTLRFYYHDRSRVIALLNLNQKYLNSEDIITKVLNDHPTMQAVQFGNWHCTELKVHNMVEAIVSKETKIMDHIEVDKTDFLKKLGERVTFLSLRGISGIERLPDSIGKLEDLRILDLRACHNLEYLPQKRWLRSHKILGLVFRQQKWLKNLIYLDISECFLLDQIPIWVSELFNLEVLKGFVASTRGKEKQFCRLGDLSKLKRLRKLSIRIAMHLDPEELSSLKSLDNLFVLTIIWGINEQSGGEQILAEAENPNRQSIRASGGEEIKRKNNGSGKVSTISFPKNLEKLDIRCYPKAEAPELLNPTELQKLKRLYIRGGKLTKIGNMPGWKVEILRLRYLKYLNFDLYHLSGIFTNLKCVEYEHCSNLKYFPKKLSYWSMKTDGAFPCASDDPTPEVLLDGQVQMTITRNKMAPLASHKQKMMLELTGWDFISDRPGLDLVVVLDFRTGMDEKLLKKLKTAMLFLIKKLSSIGRLSIVTIDDTARARNEARIVYPLNRVTKEAETLVINLKIKNHGYHPFDFGAIPRGLQMEWKIIKDLSYSSGRIAAIMLFAGTDGIRSTNVGRVIHRIGNVAVHTFCFTDDYNTSNLNYTAYHSMGGTFSDVSSAENMTKAVSVCLAGLLTVVVQDLTLTINPIKEESTLEKVSAGGYLQSKDEADGSVTVKFGDLYSKEVRKILVDLELPATDKEHESRVLKISCSYKAKEELFEPEPAIVTVSRVTNVSSYQNREPPQVIVEVYRREIVEMIEALPTYLGKDIVLSKLVAAQNIMQDWVKTEPEFQALFELMCVEIQQLVKLIQLSELAPYAFPLSLLISHDKQRTAVRDLNPEKSLIFSTPTMAKFLKEAEEFDADIHVEEIIKSKFPEDY